MKKLFLTLLILTFGISSYSQKNQLIEDKDSIHGRAIAELELAQAPPEGSIYLFVHENSIKGEYTFDITIREKGDVATVYSVGNNNGTIESQNKLKDFLMSVEFNFKMPKGKYYKFRYTLKFE